MADSKLDRELVKFLATLDSKVNRRVEKLAVDLSKELKKATVAKEVTKVKQLEKAAEKLTKQYSSDYLVIVADFSGKVAAYKAAREFKILEPILLKKNILNPITRLEKKLGTYNAYYAQQVLKRTVDGYKFSTAMKTAQKGQSQVIRAIVHNGVRDGESAAAIAKNIRGYVKPTGVKTAPFDVMRKRTGRSKKYVPRNVQGGSIQFNAIRIARTETAFTYRQATVDFYKDTDFVKGYKWVLSNTHDFKDICNEWAAKKLYKKDGSDLPTGHPNCVCDTQTVLYSDAEIVKRNKQ